MPRPASVNGSNSGKEDTVDNEEIPDKIVEKLPRAKGEKKSYRIIEEDRVNDTKDESESTDKPSGTVQDTDSGVD
jgi:hypothetical protein